MENRTGNNQPAFFCFDSFKSIVFLSNGELWSHFSGSCSYLLVGAGTRVVIVAIHIFNQSAEQLISVASIFILLSGPFLFCLPILAVRIFVVSKGFFQHLLSSLL